jgi:glycosyltransferase involved in cell wall biosynthesis
MNILLFSAYYLPGFKGGGPIRTVSNMVEALGMDFKFYIVSLDRDLGDVSPYSSVKPDSWQNVGNAKVFYSSPKNLFFNIFKIIRNFEGDVIHLNSFFSFGFGIFPMLLLRFFRPNLPIIIGPRGEFSGGAISLKPWKKKLFIIIAKSFSLYKNVTWHASTDYEAKDIYHVMGEDVFVRTAIDISIPVVNFMPREKNDFKPLQVIFISRISPKKNLLESINILKFVKSAVDFHIYGPIEDEIYWLKCKAAALDLPGHVSLNYKGSLDSSQVSRKLEEYDLFLFPTLGENFGHVIAEALSVGLPILISDKTPWRDLLSKGIGWDLALNYPENFAVCIDLCSKKSSIEYKKWRYRIRSWALRNLDSSLASEQNRQLFINLERLNNE